MKTNAIETKAIGENSNAGVVFQPTWNPILQCFDPVMKAKFLHDKQHSDTEVS